MKLVVTLQTAVHLNWYYIQCWGEWRSL